MWAVEAWHCQLGERNRKLSKECRSLAAQYGAPVSGCGKELKVKLVSLIAWFFSSAVGIQTWGKEVVSSTKVEVLEDSNKLKWGKRWTDKFSLETELVWLTRSIKTTHLNAFTWSIINVVQHCPTHSCCVLSCLFSLFMFPAWPCKLLRLQALNDSNRWWTLTCMRRKMERQRENGLWKSGRSHELETEVLMRSDDNQGTIKVRPGNTGGPLKNGIFWRLKIDIYKLKSVTQGVDSWGREKRTAMYACTHIHAYVHT